MQEVFGKWICQNCSQQALKQEKNQEEASSMSINQHRRELERNHLYSSGCSTAYQTSIPQKVSLSQEGLQKFYKAKGNHKITLKKTTIKPKQKLNNIQPNVSESIIISLQPSGRLVSQEISFHRPMSYNSHLLPNFREQKEENNFPQRIKSLGDQQTLRENTALYFQYKSIQKESQPPLASCFKIQKSKICFSSVVFMKKDDLMEEKEVQKKEQKEKSLKFNDLQEVYQYTQKTVNLEMDSKRQFAPSNLQGQFSFQGPSNRSFVSRRNDSELTNMQTEPNKNEQHQFKESPLFHHSDSFKFFGRRQRKNFTTMTPFQKEMNKSRMKTVKTIKSIDTGSEGSIIDSHFMMTVADTKEITKLI